MKITILIVSEDWKYWYQTDLDTRNFKDVKEIEKLMAEGLERTRIKMHEGKGKN